MIQTFLVVLVVLSVVALALWASLLFAFGTLQWIPGASGNSLRRLLFRVCRPVLSVADRIAPVRVGNLDLTPFAASLVLALSARFLLPWLLIASWAFHG